MVLVMLRRHVTGDSEVADLETLQSRIDVLGAVASTPLQKPELQDRLDVSRSTVNRAVRELESTGFVTRTDEGYVPTLYGDILLERYESFIDDAAEMVRAGPLLETLPPGVPMSPAMLTDASIHRSSAPAPHRPIGRFERLLEDADRMRGISRTITQSSTPDLVAERVRDGMPGELVLGSELAEYMLEHRRETERELIETGRYRLYEVDRVPYGLALLDVDEETVVVLFVYSDSNDLLGTISNDTPEAAAWARRQYCRYRSSATDISSKFLD